LERIAVKNNLPYFSHDNNARRHPKMKALIAELGYEGYGRFWVLNERIAESSGAYIDISKKVNKLDLAQELGLNGDGLDKFLSFLSDPEIDLINMKDNIITTDRTLELFEKTMENREDERERKRSKNGKNDFPDGKEEIPPGKEDIPDEFRPEKHTDKTRQDKTRQDLDKTKQDIYPQNGDVSFSENSAPEKSVSPSDHFIWHWQRNGDIFNPLARLKKPNEWKAFWEKSNITIGQIDIAMKNFIEAIKSKTIERRFIPANPDTFVLNGWIQKSQERYQKQGPPPSTGKNKPVAGKKSLGGLDT
jgi:hypothetical protein